MNPLRTAPLAALLLALAGCATPPSAPAPVLPEPPAAFKAQDGRAADDVPLPRAWWRVYGDAQLDALVAQAGRDNPGLAGAASRLAHALAQARQGMAARQPRLGLGASAQRQEGPLLNPAGQDGALYTVSANLSYELDVLGRLARAGEAATLDAQAQAGLLADARLLLQAQVVQAYLGLRALDADARALQGLLALDQRQLHIQAARVQAGTLAEHELEGQRSELAARAAERAQLQQRRNALENQLAQLLGLAPAQFRLEPRGDGAQGAAPRLAAGLPARVLERRPDVAARQKALRAAQARVGVAQSAWLPELSLNAGTGYAAPELGTLFGAAMQTWALGVLANVSLLDGGRRDAAIGLAEAELQGALADYRERVLLALREVEDALDARAQLALQADALERARDAAERAQALAQARLRNGTLSALEALRTERQALLAGRALDGARAAELQASVALARALGGGWD